MFFDKIFQAHWFFSIEAPYITKLYIIRQLKNNPVKGADFELYSLGGSERFRHFGKTHFRKAHFRGASSGSIQLKWCLGEEIEAPWFTVLHLAVDFGASGWQSTWQSFFKAYFWLLRTIWDPKPWFGWRVRRHFWYGWQQVVTLQEVGMASD